MKELEIGSYYLCIINAKEYIFKWDGKDWIDSLFGIVPRSLLENMHIAGRMVLSQSLADIKAEAVLEAANELCIKGDSARPINFTMLVNYANRIKEGWG